MKHILSQKKWVYTLYKTEKGLVLSVVCGGAGMFDVEVLLSESDKKCIDADENYLDEFAEKVRSSPEKYMVK